METLPTPDADPALALEALERFTAILAGGGHSIAWRAAETVSDGFAGYRGECHRCLGSVSLVYLERGRPGGQDTYRRSYAHGMTDTCPIRRY